MLVLNFTSVLYKINQFQLAHFVVSLIIMYCLGITATFQKKKKGKGIRMVQDYYTKGVDTEIIAVVELHTQTYTHSRHLFAMP